MHYINSYSLVPERKPWEMILNKQPNPNIYY